MPAVLRGRAWPAAAALLALTAAAAFAVRGLQRPALQIERLCDHPERLRFHSAAAATVPPAPLRWSGDDVAREWLAVDGAAGALLRSPAVDLARLDSIAITLAPGAAGGARLLWSASATPSTRDRARNVHELRPRADGPLLETIRGARLGEAPFAEPAPPPPRHLFLEGASRDAILALVRGIEVVRVEDRLRGAAGRLRVDVAGQIRDALHTAVPGELTYTTVLTKGAELRVGVSVRDRQAPLTALVQVDAGRDTYLVGAREVAPGTGWTDLRVPLPARGEVTLTLRAQASGGPGGAVLWGSPMIVPPPPLGGPPNVIVYLVDALRPDHLGFQGYAKATSPFLDALAARSLVFRRCYAGASWTKPSVATLLTSLHPQTHGVGARAYGDALPAGVPTLQRVLGRHGYVTALFTANPLGSTASGLDLGFDQTFTAAALAGHAAEAKVPAARLNGPLLAWIEAHARDRFFAFVHAVDTHPPYAAAPSETEAYDAEVAAADAALRALYERLGALGLAERTLLVVTADHGRALGERGRTGHGLSVHEDQVRVPLLLHQAGRLSPGLVEDPVHLVDVMPTVLARGGVVAPPGIQGRSLLEPRAAPPVFVSRFVFPEARAGSAGHGPEQVAMIAYPFKLIVTEAEAAHAARAELFDLATDAREEKDLAPREAERVRRMSLALHAFLREQRAARDVLVKAHGGAEADATPEMLEQLRALGYAR